MSSDMARISRVEATGKRFAELTTKGRTQQWSTANQLHRGNQPKIGEAGRHHIMDTYSADYKYAKTLVAAVKRKPLQP